MEIDNLENIEQPNKNFYIANQRLFLTYSSHIDKIKVKAYFVEKWKVKEMHICHENGDIQIPYMHSHVLVDFGKRFQSRNSRIFDWEGIHPHIKKIKTQKHIDNCYTYLAKEDPDCKYCLKLIKKGFLSSVWDAENKISAMENARNANDALAIEKLYDLKPNNTDDSWDSDEECRFKWWNWQLELINMTKNKPVEDNLVYWIWDETGRNGKTTFSKNMFLNNKQDHFYIGGLGSSRDVCETLIKAKKNGWRGRVCHINLSRQNDKLSIYNA
ncbi:unnamed protein product, partial [marine sediment metagenome]